MTKHRSKLIKVTLTLWVDVDPKTIVKNLAADLDPDGFTLVDTTKLPNGKPAPFFTHKGKRLRRNMGGKKIDCEIGDLRSNVTDLGKSIICIGQ